MCPQKQRESLHTRMQGQLCRKLVHALRYQILHTNLDCENRETPVSVAIPTEPNNKLARHQESVLLPGGRRKPAVLTHMCPVLSIISVLPPMNLPSRILQHQLCSTNSTIDTES